ncbi:MAG: hypothetical protein CLLPBCKN_006856 [Chroococcidiopsis cubana SAG 39.79]|nr:hypothetical protein [Chroococcidiopsis cubana SAG 39.79]
MLLNLYLEVVKGYEKRETIFFSLVAINATKFIKT